MTTRFTGTHNIQINFHITQKSLVFVQLIQWDKQKYFSLRAG